MSSPLKRAALLVVVAALPLPFLLFGGIVERSALWWVFLSDLVVAVIAGADRLRPASRGGRWSFDKNEPRSRDRS